MPKKPPLPPSPSQDERIVAALANVTIVLPFWGAIGAIVIWATQKEKSRYVAFQSLQAVVYHLVLVLAGFLAGACYLCSLVAFPVVMALSVSTVDPSAELSPAFMLPMAIPFAILGASVLGWFVFVIYGLAAAAATLQGKDFRYLVIGQRLEAYLAHP
ncbi:MAG TPA: DUF4870 domain-containing protein [Anaerolineales bacterium]|nr:DUF4870 domain-containing protein [Anaerolineales bacterium]